MIDPVSKENISNAVMKFLDGWWFPILDELPYLKNRGSEYHAYAILSMCRSLHAMEYRTIVSKPAAAKWAQSKFGNQWQSVIEKALIMQTGKGVFDLFDETVSFIQSTMETIKTNEN